MKDPMIPFVYKKYDGESDTIKFYRNQDLCELNLNPDGETIDVYINGVNVGSILRTDSIEDLVIKNYSEDLASGNSLAIDADRNKLIPYIATSSTLSIGITSSLQTNECIELIIKITGDYNPSTSITWSNLPSNLWKDGNKLTAVNYGQLFFIRIIINGSDIEFASYEERG